jgi:penicillin-binding protein 1C
LTHILADDAARSSAFGAHSVLELPFEMAAKTGTSKNYRDNWAIGYTREVTAGVWVGNFDGRPLRGSSGITGAGPLLREVMSAAMRDRRPARLVDRKGLIELEICKESGELPNADCPHRLKELFLPESAPSQSSRLHVRVAIDPANGLRAGARCPGAVERVFEAYPAEYTSWARSAGRPLAPERFSPRCPGKLEASAERPHVAFPFDGARFTLDPAILPDQQRIVLRAAAARSGARLVFVLKGRPLGSVGPPFSLPLFRRRRPKRRVIRRSRTGPGSLPRAESARAPPPRRSTRGG